MAEESDTRIERLEKAHQDHQGQMAEIMELLRTLVKEKGQTIGPSPQNETAHHEQKKEKSTYPIGFTPFYGPNDPCSTTHASNRGILVWLCTTLGTSE